MIGVIARASERWAAQEFFELFKTPWEFYQPERRYDVLIATSSDELPENAQLVIVYGAGDESIERDDEAATGENTRGTLVKYKDLSFPVYETLRSFSDSRRAEVTTRRTNQSVAEIVDRSESRTIQVGFNLFDEIRYLLSKGQPEVHAQCPTLEILIQMLRDWILSAGIPLVEIANRPKGRDFIVCLSHDVDFIRVTDHSFDRTILGFLYRATIHSLKSFLRQEKSLSALLRSWAAALFLPGVYLGLVKDYFLQFDRYLEIEAGLASTFYFLPFKHTPGADADGHVSQARASQYDIDDIKPELERLQAAGCEIGLHGIDAWRDRPSAQRELERIRGVVGDAPIGVRMHWLYDSEDAIKSLETAGFHYDSTRGYNDAIGYRNGTTQAFRPPEVTKIMELPLNVMDSALFYPSRMNVSEAQAQQRIEELIAVSERFGGLLMINWHHRSLGPERFWGKFYEQVVGSLKSLNVWFAKAGEIASWFEWRRSARFEKVTVEDGALSLKVAMDSNHAGQPMALRVSIPSSKSDTAELTVKEYEFPLTDSLDTKIDL